MADHPDLAALLDKATPGPWHWTDEGELVMPDGVSAIEACDPLTDPDAVALVAAYNALPDLLAIARWVASYTGDGMECPCCHAEMGHDFHCVMPKARKVLGR